MGFFPTFLVYALGQQGLVSPTHDSGSRAVCSVHPVIRGHGTPGSSGTPDKDLICKGHLLDGWKRNTEVLVSTCSLSCDIFLTSAQVFLKRFVDTHKTQLTKSAMEEMRCMEMEEGISSGCDRMIEWKISWELGAEGECNLKGIECNSEGG